MTAARIAGEFVGSLIVSFLLADRFGRRITIITTAVLYLVGQVFVVAAYNRGMFVAGRVVNGLGAGPLFQTVS
jgi:MFS family permease